MAWGCVSSEAEGLLGVVVLRRRVVGTGCGLWSQLLPVAAIDGKKFRSGRGLGFLAGSAKEPGVIGSLPRIDCHEAGLDFYSK